MQHVRKQAKFAEERGLFRAANAKDIFTFQCFSFLLGPPSKTSEEAFGYDSLPKVAKVDYFISHSWHCSSWIKRLALCHCLNLNLAIASSTLTCFLGVLILVLRAGAFTAIAQQPRPLLYGLLSCGPTAAFLGAYLFGHLLDSRGFWFDQLCVDQKNSEVKGQILQAIPAFVAHSDHMLVLWDETYFQRLWCNYELAVRAKASSELQVIQFAPTWTPVWVLSCFALFTIISWSLTKQVWSNQIDLATRTTIVLCYVLQWLPAVCKICLCSAVPCSWLCLQKLQSHKLMLDQMEQFDLRSAKCTLESDRKVIEEQVLDLFDEALEPPLHVAFDTAEENGTDVPLISRSDMDQIRHITSYPSHDEVIDQFNAYVRGPLRESVEASIGKEDYISLHTCLAANLPFMFAGFIIALGCDGQTDCQNAASYWGYTSVPKYMVFETFLNCIVSPGFFMLLWPLVLRTNGLVARTFSNKHIRMLAGSLCTLLTLSILYCCLNLQWALCVVVGTKYCPIWLSACLAGFAVELSALWFVFFRKQTLPAQSRNVCLM